jgi:hypothetical protein
VTDRDYLVSLCAQIPDSEVKGAVKFLEFLRGASERAPLPPQPLDPRRPTGETADAAFDDAMRRAVLQYHDAPTTDPFLLWFQRLDGSARPDLGLRLRAIITNARFNQNVRAESALQNTIAVLDCGLLDQREAGDSDLPLLVGDQIPHASGLGAEIFRSYAAYLGPFTEDR